MKTLVAMVDRRCAYVLLAIENQSEVHYAMPVKNMVSDALQYAKQIEKAAVAHKAAKDYRGKRAGAEFLSGFSKDDRLVPVITLVIQFNDEEWDAPYSLHEMFQTQDTELLRLVQRFVNPHSLSTCYFRQCCVGFNRRCHRIASFSRLALTKISGT